MDIIISAFTSGGWGLVLAVILAYGGKTLYEKLSAKFEELNNKVDELRSQITALKVNSERYATALRLCDRPDCKAKQILEDNR